MANATESQHISAFGVAGPAFHLGVAASTSCFKGTFISQLSTGYAVPYSTASSGVCVGVAQADALNASGSAGDVRVKCESRRMFAVPNGTAGDAFADTDLIGSLVYATDDHTAAKTSSTQTRKAVGFFFGLEDDGLVRVFVDPPLARLIDKLQTLTDTPATADALRDNIVASFG